MRSRFLKQDGDASKIKLSAGYLGSSVGMPVHGLWDVLRSRGLLQEAKNGEDLRRLLEGKAVAVDLST